MVDFQEIAKTVHEQILNYSDSHGVFFHGEWGELSNFDRSSAEAGVKFYTGILDAQKDICPRDGYAIMYLQMRSEDSALDLENYTDADMGAAHYAYDSMSDFDIEKFSIFHETVKREYFGRISKRSA